MAVIGRSLLLNGADGLLELSGDANALQIKRLTMVGEVISDSAQQCRIEVGGGAEINAKSLGRPDGVMRFEADLPACPFEFDVLDGAVFVPDRLRACVFKEADCQASPAGLWGPAGGSLPTDAKSADEARLRAEAAMTASYRRVEERLTDRAKGDELAREQARFLSDRDDLCRRYSLESVHGFCATRLTEARAALLMTRAGELPPPAEGEKRPIRRKASQ